MKKLIFKRIIPTVVLTSLLIGTSQLVALATATKYDYNLTPNGIGAERWSSQVTKQENSDATNLNSVVQGNGTLISSIRRTSDWVFVTDRYNFTTGAKFWMPYYDGSANNGKVVQLQVESQLFDPYGRNAYGYWSPDQLSISY